MGKKRLPKQVRRQAKEADKLHAEMYPSEAEPGDVIVDDPTVVAKAEEPEASAAPVVVESAPAEEIIPAVDKERVNKVETTDLEVDYKEKYIALQGKYDAEFTNRPKENELSERLESANNMIQQLQQSNQGLSNVLDAVNEANDKKTPPLPETPAFTAESPDSFGDPLSALSEDERKVLKDEGLDGKVLPIIRKLIKAQAQETTNAAVKPLAETVEATARNTRTSALEKFWGHVEDAVPDWVAINGNKKANVPQHAEWKPWLREPVTPYGNAPSRNQVLGEAQKHHDHRTVIKMFKDFKELHGIGVPAPAPTNGEDKHNPLEDQLSPSSSSTTQLPATKAAVKIWLKSEITAFYAKAARDRKFRESEEYTRDNKDILQAQNEEGRVVNG